MVAVIIIASFIILSPLFGIIFLTARDIWRERTPKQLKWKTKAEQYRKDCETQRKRAAILSVELQQVKNENEAMRVMLGWPTEIEIQKTERELALEAAKAAIKMEYPEIEFKDEQ